MEVYVAGLVLRHCPALLPVTAGIVGKIFIAGGRRTLAQQKSAARGARSLADYVSALQYGLHVIVLIAESAATESATVTFYVYFTE